MNLGSEGQRSSFGCRSGGWGLWRAVSLDRCTVVGHPEDTPDTVGDSTSCSSFAAWVGTVTSGAFRIFRDMNGEAAMRRKSQLNSPALCHPA